MCQNVGCSAFGCLESARQRSGAFACHDEEVVVAGIITCANCPTAIAPEKILNRFRTLTELGIDAIHFSSCVEALCPFKEKYADLVARHYPRIQLIRGSHDMPRNPTSDTIIAGLKNMLIHSRMTMVDASKLSGILDMVPGVPRGESEEG